MIYGCPFVIHVSNFPRERCNLIINWSVKLVGLERQVRR
jgi:hypothetical protein